MHWKQKNLTIAVIVNLRVATKLSKPSIWNSVNLNNGKIETVKRIKLVVSMYEDIKKQNSCTSLCQTYNIHKQTIECSSYSLGNSCTSMWLHCNYTILFINREQLMFSPCLHICLILLKAKTISFTYENQQVWSK